MKRAILRCEGTLELGFKVTLEIKEDNLSLTEVGGALPPAIELLARLTQWQQDYHLSLGVSRITLESIAVETGTLTQIETCRNSEGQLKAAIQTWLGAIEFQPIDRRLRETLAPQEAVEILLRTPDLRLHRLPWHVWDLMERYPHAELVAGSPLERIVLPPRTRTQVRILAILGDPDGIDIAADRATLAALPNAEVVFLVEPTQAEICDRLWDETWDVLFFAGHSKTEYQQGRLYLSSTESVTLGNLDRGLRHAIANGLQLTIFNSCDGLGLAYELAKLHVPQSIVMREPIPDRVAQAFLKRFLNAFAAGVVLPSAVRQARESLQGLESEFPAASWLPLVFQNPALPSLTWQDLQGQPELEPVAEPVEIAPPLPVKKSRSRGGWTLLASLGIAGCIMVLRYMGALQTWELNAYDRLMRSRPPESPDPRLIIVTVTEADLQMQAQAKEPRSGSLSDRSLDRLLTTLIAARPIAIGLDIYRDYPVDNSAPALASRLKTDDLIVGTCKVSDTETRDPGVAPPPELTADNLGFSDVLLDPDRAIRRHYLALDPPPASLCKAPYALSVRLALRYLATKGIALEYLPNDVWQLGKLKFTPLTAYIGSDRSIDTSGHQILLNYRATPNPIDIAPRVTLQEVASGKVGAAAFKDRIVLIGTTAPSFHDTLTVPYATDRGEIQSLPGVVVQAQMVSQLVAAALDGRPLIRPLPLAVDALWIWSASVGGCWLGYTVRRRLYLGLAGVGAIGLVSGMSFFLLQLGCWIPSIPIAIAIGTSGSITRFVEWRRERGS